MTTKMKVCITHYNKQYYEYIIDNPVHVPHVGDSISFSHLKMDDKSDLAYAFEIGVVDHEYNLENNTLTILVIAE